MTPEETHVLLYGDVNCNIIDGSSIWLLSTAEVLTRAGARVTVLLKSELRNRRIVDAVDALPGVDVVDPWTGEPSGEDDDRSLPPRRAAQILARLAEERRADVILCRGLLVCSYLVTNPTAADRLWAYVTDVPRRREDAAAHERLASVAREARHVLAQTEDARSHLEAMVPEACGKTLLLTPMVPDDVFRGPVPAASYDAGEPLRLVYSGKFAKDWRTLEMPRLPGALSAHGVRAELTMIGDKVQSDRVDQTWAGRMRVAAEGQEGSPAVRWTGGLPRAEALDLAREHHLGLGWRTSALDDSLELSTKLLEYAALGVPPVVNRTAAHEALLGADYPFLVDGSVTDVLSLATNPDLHARAAERAREAVRPYSMTAAAERLRTYLGRYVPHRRDPDATPTRVVLAGHDLKFASDVLDALLMRPDLFDVRVDLWESLHRHDEQRSRELLEWADVVFCEWAGPNSVWYAGRMRPDQRLVVRFHGFEIRGPWIEDLEAAAVDEVVFVSDHYRRHVVAALGWQDVTTSTVPNSVDFVDFSRPKLSGAEWRLGLVGAVPMLKRPDRALDLLEELLLQDECFVLHIRSRAPWDYPWEWTKPAQRDAYEVLMDRVESRELVDHVVLEDFGSDMASWYRKIGWILSPSTRETFHMATLEGMASGCVPVVWRRAGAPDIFGSKWVVDDTAAAVQRVRDGLTGQRHALWSAAARDQRDHDMVRQRSHWWRLLTGGTWPTRESEPAKTVGRL